jgi:hypothetical protein
MKTKPSVHNTAENIVEAGTSTQDQEPIDLFEPMAARKFIPVAASHEQHNHSEGVRIISYNILGPWQALTDKHNYRYA